MNKPYIVRHMMTSVDGRIDCAMTAQLAGVDAYYETLNALETPTTLTGRVTAALGLSLAALSKPKIRNLTAKRDFPKKPPPPDTKSSSTRAERFCGTTIRNTTRRT